jgi:serine phosphatase RsbU (regulator of sigma subunit)
VDEQVQSFTSKNIQLQKNDILYLFSDGYADQFGGDKGKKFKYKQLKEI